MALGETGTFDFFLAERLGMSLGAVRALPYQEILDWSAYFKWAAAIRDLEARHAGRKHNQG